MEHVQGKRGAVTRVDGPLSRESTLLLPGFRVVPTEKPPSARRSTIGDAVAVVQWVYLSHRSLISVLGRIHVLIEQYLEARIRNVRDHLLVVIIDFDPVIDSLIRRALYLTGIGNSTEHSRSLLADRIK